MAIDDLASTPFCGAVGDSCNFFTNQFWKNVWGKSCECSSWSLLFYESNNDTLFHVVLSQKCLYYTLEARKRHAVKVWLQWCVEANVDKPCPPWRWRDPILLQSNGLSGAHLEVHRPVGVLHQVWRNFLAVTFSSPIFERGVYYDCKWIRDNTKFTYHT